jgi:hypothetical protein
MQLFYAQSSFARHQEQLTRLCELRLELTFAGQGITAPCPVFAVILSERSESKDLLLANLARRRESSTLNKPVHEERQ